MKTANEVIIAIKNGEQVDDKELKLACLVLNSLLTIGNVNMKNLIKGGEIASLTVRKEFPGSCAEVGISQTESMGLNSDPVKWIGESNIPDDLKIESGIRKKEKREISIDEAIAHCNDVVAKLAIDHAYRLNQLDLKDEYESCENCISEHKQLAKWLEEYKELKKYKDKKLATLSKKVRDLCREYNAEFYFLTDGHSEWNVTNNSTIKKIVECHKNLLKE